MKALPAWQDAAEESGAPGLVAYVRCQGGFQVALVCVWGLKAP